MSVITTAITSRNHSLRAKRTIACISFFITLAYAMATFYYRANLPHTLIFSQLNFVPI